MSTIAQGYSALTKISPCAERPKYHSWQLAAGAVLQYVASEYCILFCETCWHYHIDFHKPEAERKRIDFSTIKAL